MGAYSTEPQFCHSLRLPGLSSTVTHTFPHLKPRFGTDHELSLASITGGTKWTLCTESYGGHMMCAFLCKLVLCGSYQQYVQSQEK